MVGKMLTLILGCILLLEVHAFGANPQQVKEKSKTYPYLAYLPNGYKESIGKDWPVIIYLHGSSCKGNNLDRLKKYGPPFYLDRGMQVDAIVISPQCPSNRNWVYGDWLLRHPALLQFHQGTPVVVSSLMLFWQVPF